jgi:hypothetical protein
VPVWEFNSLQLSALFLVHSRKKAAEELKLLAMISSAAGNSENAINSFLKMQELSNPQQVQEREEFAEKSQSKYEKLASKFLNNKKE